MRYGRCWPNLHQVNGSGDEDGPMYIFLGMYTALPWGRSPVCCNALSPGTRGSDEDVRMHGVGRFRTAAVGVTPHLPPQHTPHAPLLARFTIRLAVLCALRRLARAAPTPLAPPRLCVDKRGLSALVKLYFPRSLFPGKPRRRLSVSLRAFSPSLCCFYRRIPPPFPTPDSSKLAGAVVDGADRDARLPLEDGRRGI